MGYPFDITVDLHHLGLLVLRIPDSELIDLRVIRNYGLRSLAPDLENRHRPHVEALSVGLHHHVVILNIARYRQICIIIGVFRRFEVASALAGLASGTVRGLLAQRSCRPDHYSHIQAVACRGNDIGAGIEDTLAGTDGKVVAAGSLYQIYIGLLGLFFLLVVSVIF